MAPEVLATVLILLSAVLHAVVNAMVKISDDGLITRGCMNAVALLVAVPCLAFVEPPDAALWPLLLVAMLVHGLYPFFLVGAYRYSDLSVAFPVARGIAPLGVVLLAYWLLESVVSPAKLACIALASVGIAAFAYERIQLGEARHRKGMLMAVCTGGIVAVYTLVDAMGLRTASDPNTYIVWLFFLDGLFVSSMVGIARRGLIPRFLTQHWRKALLSGVLGVITYGLALYALSLGSIVEVAALRETSVVFAALIGALFLKESFGIARISATAMVVTAVIGIRLST